MNRKGLLVGDFAVSDDDVTVARAYVEKIVANYDVLANFELSPVQSECKKKSVNLIAGKEVMYWLSMQPGLSFSLVNNHLEDGGQDFDALSFALKPINTIHTPSSLIEPVKWGSNRLIFFGDAFEDVELSGPFNRFEKRAIDELELKDTICIVHGGIEYRRFPTLRQRSLAHRLVDRGAKSVIFHHSHVEGVWENYCGRLIHYGLGNFLFSSIDGLHGIDFSQCPAIQVDHVTGDLIPGVLVRGKFAPSDSCNVLPTMENYKDFYKKKYKLDSSLRPRQLSNSDSWNNFVFYCWAFFARRLVKLGVSKPIKRIIQNVFKR